MLNYNNAMPQGFYTFFWTSKINKNIYVHKDKNTLQRFLFDNKKNWCPRLKLTWIFKIKLVFQTTLLLFHSWLVLRTHSCLVLDVLIYGDILRFSFGFMFIIIFRLTGVRFCPSLLYSCLLSLFDTLTWAWILDSYIFFVV